MFSNNFMHETKRLAFLDLTHSTEGFALQIIIKSIKTHYVWLLIVFLGVIQETVQ